MAQIKADEITKIIREQIENFDRAVTVAEVGSVISVGDGVARIHGLDRVMAGELLELPHDVAGLALLLRRLVDEPEIFRRAGEAARARVEAGI